MVDRVTTDLTPELKLEIDGMSREEMAYHWRFDPTPSKYFGNSLEVGDYFKKVFQEKGGFSPEISKRLGSARRGAARQGAARRGEARAREWSATP